MRRLAVILLSTTMLTAPAPASADPVSIAVGLASAALAASPIATGLGAFAWGAFALNATLALASAGLGLLQRQSAPSLSSGMSGRAINIRQPISPRVTVYGRQKVGGTLIYAERTTRDDVDGDGNDERETYHHYVFALTGHEIDAFESFWIGDKRVDLDENGVVTNTVYKNRARIQTRLGTANQTAFESLVEESAGKWTNAHRGRGCSLIYVKFWVTPELLKTQFPPNVSAIIRGKKVRNLASNAVEWSENAVHCTYDYIRSLGEKIAHFDEPSFVGAAQIADEDVAGKVRTIKRYTCNGVVKADSEPQDALRSLLTTTAGALCWTGGSWHYHAGVWRTPVMTLDEDDLRGPVKILPRHSMADNFNGVKGTFVGAETNWQPDSYPAIRSSYFVSVDNGHERFAEVNLPFTAYSAEAQRLAKISLYRNREQLTVTSTFGLRALRLVPGDTVRLNLSRFGLRANTSFEVVRWKLKNSDDFGMTIDMTLREITSEVFRWNADERLFERNNTNLPDPTDAEPPTILVSAELREINESVVPVLMIEVIGSNGADGVNEVQIRLQGKQRWRAVGHSASRYFEVPNVRNSDIFDIRARAYNVFGTPSDWSYRYNVRISAFSEPPAVVEGFDVTLSDDMLQFQWSPVPDLDLSHYIIKWSPRVDGSAQWGNSTRAARKIPRPATSVVLPSRDGTYLIRAVDKDGNLSPEASAAIVVNTDLLNRNILQAFNEHPTFAGSSNENVELHSSPAGTGLIITTTPGTGNYNFANTIDLGDVYPVTIRSVVQISRYELNGRLFDSVPGLFDNQRGLFENEDTSGLETSVYVAYRNSTGDDWSSWRELTRGKYVGRYFKFRAVLESEVENVSPLVEQLRVVIDVPDRVESGTGVVSNAAGTSIVFDPDFRELQGVVITADDLNSGDYYRITGRSAAGFTIRFFNSSGTGVSRTFDWVAKGFGYRGAA